MNPVDIDVQPGQILGLAGLLGSGRTETARLLFGAERADAGTMTIGGKPAKLHSPRDAVRHGVGYCPEDRKKEGIVAELSIRENIMLALQARRGWWRLHRPARSSARSPTTTSNASASRRATPSSRSGCSPAATSRRSLLARWLATEPKMLILDEPTRGIDVAAKLEIMDRVLALCAKGLGDAVHFVGDERGRAREPPRSPCCATAARSREVRGQRGDRRIRCIG